MLRRGCVVWIVIILAESLHGAVRVLWLEPYLGASRARPIAFFTGMTIILAIAVAFIRWIRATDVSPLLAVGGLWAFLTFGFECLLGRYVMNYSWERIFVEYDPRKGGLMSIGMIFLTLAPVLAAKMRKSLSGDQFATVNADSERAINTGQVARRDTGPRLSRKLCASRSLRLARPHK